MGDDFMIGMFFIWLFLQSLSPLADCTLAWYPYLLKSLYRVVSVNQDFRLNNWDQTSTLYIKLSKQTN